MSRLEESLKAARYAETRETKEAQVVILADIAVSLAKIADSLESPIRIEEVKAAPTYYTYYDPNEPILNRGIGGNGGRQDAEL